MKDKKTKNKNMKISKGDREFLKEEYKRTSGGVAINEDAKEPHEYFKLLKEQKNKANNEALQKQLEAIASYILKAKELGQKSLLEKLAFTYEVIIKEQQLLANGVDTFIYEKDVKAYHEVSKHIRIIELSRYPRFIPVENMEDIKRVKDLGIFEEFCIVFTDYTENDHKTDKEKAAVARNRDPIVFGHFRHKETGIKHDRLYFITDWEDEECDLTFPDLIKKMADAGIENAEHKITADATYINEIVRSTMTDMSKKISNSLSFTNPNEPKSFWERLKIWKK